MDFKMCPRLNAMLAVITAVREYEAKDAMSISLRASGNGFFFRGVASYSNSVRSVRISPALAENKIVLEFETDQDTPVLLRVTPNEDIAGAAEAVVKWFVGFNEKLFDCPENGSLGAFTVVDIQGKIRLAVLGDPKDA